MHKHFKSAACTALVGCWQGLSTLNQNTFDICSLSISRSIGKTAPNRLRRTDNFLTMYEPELLQRESGDFEGALFVDLGYGFWPTTTLESAARFRKLNSNLPVLGVEIDRLRVREAQRWADEITHFRVGGKWFAKYVEFHSSS